MNEALPRIAAASAGEAGRWIHFGLTSSDVLDTALALQLRRAGEVIVPGAVAAHTDLPVIGVPLRSSLSVLDGLDALLAIAQMPPGVPVACVGVDNARNAAVLAARILAA